MTITYDTYRKLELEAFDIKKVPTMALWNLGKEVQLNGIAKRIQKRFLKNIPAVDVALGTGGRYNSAEKYGMTDFVVPEYNEIGKLTEEDVFKVHFGENEYTNIANIVNLVTDEQKTLQEKIVLAQNLQARDALFYGKIKLISGAEIDFDMKDSHKITAVNAWSSANGVPNDDIEKACRLIIGDGRLSGNVFHMYMADDVLNALISNENFKKTSDLNAGYDRRNVSLPVEKTPGVAYHGVSTVGSNIVHLWGYNETYTIPTGFNFADEGTEKTFIPTGQTLIFHDQTQFEANYGAINDTNNQKSDVPTGRLNLKKVKYLPYSYGVTQQGSSWTDYGVKARPLFIPVNVDGYAVLKGLTA